MTADPRATLRRWHAILQTDAPWVPPQHTELVTALRRLEPGPRDAVLLSSLDGLPVARIADILDEAAGTIAYWVSLARRRLDPVTHDLRGSLIEIEASAPEVAETPPARRLSAIAWFGVPITIALVVAMIGVAQLTKRDQPAGGVGTNPSTPPSTPIVTAIEWSEVRFVKDATIQQLGVAAGRVIALGHLRGSPADAWYSDDGGETWASAELEVDPPSEGAVLSFQGMAANGDTVVAYGEWQTTDQSQQAQASWKSWLSIDRGSTWTESESLQSGVATSIVAGGGDFLVAGQDIGRGSVMLWRSSDGLSWAQETPRGLPQFAATITGMATFDSQYAAVGINTRGSRPRIGMWTSADGRSWSGIDGAPVDAGMLTGVAAGPQGIAAVGFTTDRPDGSDARPFLWHSNDAVAWSQLPLDDQPARPISVASGPLGSMVLGFPITRGESSGLQVWFVPTDFSSATATDFGGSVGVVALPDRFVSGGGCADAACTRSKVVIGDPVATATPAD
jgi:hypothetical protein